jgi:hypothetical protein
VPAIEELALQSQCLLLHCRKPVLALLGRSDQRRTPGALVRDLRNPTFFDRQILLGVWSFCQPGDVAYICLVTALRRA